MTEKTPCLDWLTLTNEEEARVFWGVEGTSGSLRRDACGGDYPPKFPLPLLVWLRVFQDEKLQISAKKVDAAHSYQAELMKKDPRKRLIFSGSTRNAKNPKKFKFSEIINTDARKLIPFKRHWSVELQPIRRAPQSLKGQVSQISTGQMKLIKEALNELTHIKKKKLWMRTPEDPLDCKKTSLFCTTYKPDSLTILVSEKIGEIRHPPSSKGTRPPALSIVRKALSTLVSFRPLNKPVKVNPDL